MSEEAKVCLTNEASYHIKWAKNYRGKKSKEKKV